MLRRKYKKRSTPHPRLCDVLRRMAWPIGERRELALWARAASYTLPAAVVLATVCVMAFVTLRTDALMHIFVRPGSGPERWVFAELCGQSSVDWTACAPARMLPVVVAAGAMLPALFVWYIRH
jgi:hypothetical protein